MISDIWFAVKMLALTVVIVLVMQVHVGSDSLENRAYLFIHSSSITAYLERVAAGGVKIVGDTYHKLTGGSHKQNHRRTHQ